MGLVPTDKNELSLFANYSSLDARYFITNTISVAASYQMTPFEIVSYDVDIDKIGVSLRFDF